MAMRRLTVEDNVTEAPDRNGLAELLATLTPHGGPVGFALLELDDEAFVQTEWSLFADGWLFEWRTDRLGDGHHHYRACQTDGQWGFTVPQLIDLFAEPDQLAGIEWITWHNIDHELEGA